MLTIYFHLRVEICTYQFGDETFEKRHESKARPTRKHETSSKIPKSKLCRFFHVFACVNSCNGLKRVILYCLTIDAHFWIEKTEKFRGFLPDFRVVSCWFRVVSCWFRVVSCWFRVVSCWFRVGFVFSCHSTKKHESLITTLNDVTCSVARLAYLAYFWHIFYFLKGIWHMKYAKKNWHIFGIYFNSLKTQKIPS